MYFDYDPTRLNPAQFDALDREAERLFAMAPEKAPVKKAQEPCKRCGGKGGFKHYAHVLGGVCFRCWGLGIEMSPAERQAAGQAAKNLKMFGL